MKIAVEVDVPPQVVISTELLASLIGSERVVALLNQGSIRAGQKRNERGNKKLAAPAAITDADLAAARNELAEAASSFEEVVKGVTR